MISFGTKNIKITRRNQQIIFIIQPPWCIPSRGSLWVFTPVIKTARIVKNRKFPKLTRKTASVSNHSLLGVWLKWLIPAVLTTALTTTISSTHLKNFSHPTVHPHHQNQQLTTHPWRKDMKIQRDLAPNQKISLITNSKDRTLWGIIRDPPECKALIMA